MRIAFYPPMKPPDHPVPSGDRTMARLLIAALERAGHDVVLASQFRSWDSDDERRRVRLAALGGRLARRALRQIQRHPERRPSLWFTYHLYHKAPDYLGPRVAAALGIPYVVTEASYAAKHGDTGANAAVAAALACADAVVGLNRADRAGVLPLLADPARWIDLPPFIDTAPWRAARRERGSARRLLAERHDLNAEAPWLIAVAMMRRGDKLRSYTTLAAGLARLLPRRWRLLVAGAGPAQAEVRALFAPFAGRIAWLGELTPPALAAALAASDIFVWPAVNEAYGLALLEAQAAGLAAVVGAAGGIPDIVADGVTGRLVPPGDADTIAAALASLLDDPALSRRWGEAAAERMARLHDLAPAAERLDGIVQSLTRRGAR
ncbi:MAG TPA: glycosyltransferase family 4 protein [Stellaceae bacterium]|nr:glycosyltransferase family 4 protein [Stellaceae bacterium]